MFQSKFAEKIKTHFMFNNNFFRKSCRLWDNVGKCGRDRQTDHTRQCNAAQKSCDLHAGI